LKEASKLISDQKLFNSGNYEEKEPRVKHRERNQLIERNMEYYNECYTRQDMGFNEMENTLIKESFICSKFSVLFGDYLTLDKNSSISRIKTTKEKSFKWFKKKMTYMQGKKSLNTNSGTNNYLSFFEANNENMELNMLYQAREIKQMTLLMSNFIGKSH
jgi:hypothetical protein